MSNIEIDLINFQALRGDYALKKDCTQATLMLKIKCKLSK